MNSTHKNEASVRSYTNKLTLLQSKGMSGILSNSLGYSSPNNSTDDLAIESNDRSVASTSLIRYKFSPCNEPSQRPTLVTR